MKEARGKACICCSSEGKQLKDMPEIIFEVNGRAGSEELRALYDDSGWTNYTCDMQLLTAAMENSLFAVTARKEGELAGLVRCVGDGRTIVYVQDVIVRSDVRRRGIGARLIEHVLEKFRDVRQIVLLADNSEELRKFYRSVGFDDAGTRGLACFVRIVSKK